MGQWWQEDIVEPGKLPLLLLTLAFVATFALTRVIVRMIRAGKGPFSDNSVGGVHVHHVVPGLALLVLGGLVAFGAQTEAWRAAAALVFGIGLALVLDEFALVLHLEDVYWEKEGRMSVDIVLVLLGVLVLSLLMGSPVGIDEQTDQEVDNRISLMIWLVLLFASAFVAAAKGKLASAVIGIFFAPVAFVAAIRLGRPDSAWARHRYANRPKKQARAVDRAARFDVRWRSKLESVRDAVAGKPNEPPGEPTIEPQS